MRAKRLIRCKTLFIHRSTCVLFIMICPSKAVQIVFYRYFWIFLRHQAHTACIKNQLNLKVSYNGKKTTKTNNKLFYYFKKMMKFI